MLRMLSALLMRFLILSLSRIKTYSGNRGWTLTLTPSLEDLKNREKMLKTPAPPAQGTTSRKTTRNTTLLRMILGDVMDLAGGHKRMTNRSLLSLLLKVLLLLLLMCLMFLGYPVLFLNL